MSSYCKFTISLLSQFGYIIDEFVVEGNRLYYISYTNKSEVTGNMKHLVALSYVLFTSIVAQIPCFAFNLDKACDITRLFHFLEDQDIQLIFSSMTRYDIPCILTYQNNEFRYTL